MSSFMFIQHISWEYRLEEIDSMLCTAHRRSW